jgi:hypothetical protein
MNASQFQFLGLSNPSEKAFNDPPAVVAVYCCDLL